MNSRFHLKLAANLSKDWGPPLTDYGVEAYPALMDALIEKVPRIIGGKPFREQMKRFLPEDRYQRSLGNPRAERYLTATILELYRELKSGLA